MKKILVISKNVEIIKAVEKACATYATYFTYSILSEVDDVVKNIEFDLPEIKVIDFTSPSIDSGHVLKIITDDPWLHNGGIIAVAQNNEEVQKIEEIKNRNILIVQTQSQFIKHFTRLLRILQRNQQFLFSRSMQELLGVNETGSFISTNDPIDIQVYTSFLINYLFSSNRIDESRCYKLQTALMELLLNALEHGNCGIGYEEKTKWLESGKDILDLIAQKNLDPNIAKKHIYISYSLEKKFVVFKIRDEGAGFDWRNRLSKKVEPGMHGMGIAMSNQLTDSLQYNDAGNEVSFSLPLNNNETNVVPKIMSPYEQTSYADKEIVCKQNEVSNHLFFIVSGRYAVYSARNLVSVLTPKDIFIGEMAFLLNDRRSATIMSIGNGKLIKIPKAAFVNLIRNNPHYGIFLSKLLAQRLFLQTQKTIALNNHNKT